VLAPEEIDRFLDLAERLPELTPEEVRQLTIVAELGVLAGAPAPKGLF
jgi:2-methylcitrate dehydratase